VVEVLHAAYLLRSRVLGSCSPHAGFVAGTNLPPVLRRVTAAAKERPPGLLPTWQKRRSHRFRGLFAEKFAISLGEATEMFEATGERSIGDVASRR
jgi:hypothetical protein